MQYDLEKRTKSFSVDVIKLCQTLEQNVITKPLISQLTRSATSIGANYREANGASSKKDFKNKIAICRKEAQETEYWIELIAEALPKKKVEMKILWKESHELTLIFGKIAATLRKEK